MPLYEKKRGVASHDVRAESWRGVKREAETSMEAGGVLCSVCAWMEGRASAAGWELGMEFGMKLGDGHTPRTPMTRSQKVECK